MVIRRLHTTALLLVTTLVLASCSGGKVSSDKDGSQGNAIIETGELAAVNSWNYTMEQFARRWNELTIIGLVEHGTMLKAGDSIAQFDPADINKYIINRQDQLETQLAALEKLYVDQDNNISDLNASIRNGIAAFDLKKIELEASKFEPQKIQRIKQLEFKQAEITLAKEKRRLELAKIINEINLNIQKTRVEQVRKDINIAQETLPTLTIRTPTQGVFQIASRGRSGHYKIGDQISRGNMLAIVPDLTWMKVNTSVAETDFRKISIGQKVDVRLDALPKVVFKGEVSFISKLCYYKDNNPLSRQKIFDVEVSLLVSDERLKPGMTVSCEFL